MRVAAVRVDAHVRRIAGLQTFAAERFHDPLLHLELVCAAIARAPADFLEKCCRDFVDAVASFEVRCDLRVGQSSFETRHQICRADNLLVETAHQFQHARVYQRDVRNLVVRRILHGHLVIRLEHGFQVLPQLLPC